MLLAWASKPALYLTCRLRTPSVTATTAVGSIKLTCSLHARSIVVPRPLSTMSVCPPYAPFFGFAGVASSVRPLTTWRIDDVLLTACLCR